MNSQAFARPSAKSRPAKGCSNKTDRKSDYETLTMKMRPVTASSASRPGTGQPPAYSVAKPS
jgi:hypothetical protein